MTWRHVMFAIASPQTLEPAALNKAAQLAKALDAELELFQCVYDADIARIARLRPGGMQQAVRDLVENHHQPLEAVAERLRGQGVQARSSVRWDYPAYEGIVRQVLRYKPQLVIAQSTRRTRVGRRVLTHTDFKLIESCPCPLLLVKSIRPYADVRVLAAVDPTHAHDKPAVLDKAILDAASALSRALRGELHVVHVCPNWTEVSKESRDLSRVPRTVREEIQAGYCETARTRVATLARSHKVPKDQVHVEEGYAVVELPRFAQSLKADIVALGAVSRTVVQRILLGHTAEHVLDELECDVLIAKAPGFRSPVSVQSVHRLPRREARRTKYVF